MLCQAIVLPSLAALYGSLPGCCPTVLFACLLSVIFFSHKLLPTPLSPSQRPDLT
jgi:hypothetical protein